MNRARLTFLGGVAGLALAALAAGPSPAQPPVPQEVPHADFGPLSLRGYELRELRFDPPFRVVRDDGSLEQKKFGWQIVIKGDSFPTRALDPILWVDDVALTRYERCAADGSSALAYSFFDPKLLRGEHVLQVIYGKDERTRTKLLERLDPERLVRLPEAQRRELGMPELEGLTLKAVGADGHVEGAGRLGEGEIRIAARLGSGAFRAMPGTVKLGAEGRFALDAGAWPKGTTHAAALLVPAGVDLGSGELAALPKRVELLDMKPLGTKP
jgi:hypothetical protein